MCGDPNPWGEAERLTDQLINVTCSITELLDEANRRNKEIIDWTTARELSKRQQAVPSATTNLWHLWIGATAHPKVTLVDFVANPEHADWTLFHVAVAPAAIQLEYMSANLAYQCNKFPTTPELKILSERLAPLTKAFYSLISLGPPESQDDWRTLKRFLERYVVLADHMIRFSTTISDHVKRLKTNGKWPIRGN